MKIYDAVIVGEGPAGMAAALYLARSGCSVLMFEKLTPGGQLLLTEALENYPGFPESVKGYELADLFYAQVDKQPNIERVRGEVASISGAMGQFEARVQGEDTVYNAKTVLICSGAKHRHLGLPNEEKLIGRGVSYCALCDGNFYRGQEVAVAGGGNSALEESLYLAKLVKKVHIIHRRDTFRAAKIYQEKVFAQPDKIEVHFDSRIAALLGENDLQGVRLLNIKTEKESDLPVNGLFIYIGFEPDTSFLPPDIQRDPQGFIITDAEMRTNTRGIFAAGDIRSKLCRQVVTAVGDGATAAQAAFLLLEQM